MQERKTYPTQRKEGIMVRRNVKIMLFMLVGVCLAASFAGAAAPPAKAAEAARPVGSVSFFQLYHKSTLETMQYLKKFHPEFVDKGYVRILDSSDRTLAIIGDPKMTASIGGVVSKYDSADLKLEPHMIKLRHIAPLVALESLGIAGVCQVWHLVDEHGSKTWKVGKQTHKFEFVAPKYTKWEPAQYQKSEAEQLPFVGLPEVPYVCELTQWEGFKPPPMNLDLSSAQYRPVEFDNTSSTEERNRLLVIGTKEDSERIKAFLDIIDRPAKQVMIEVQIVELDADAATDIGIDSIGFAKRHSIVNFNTAFPGEPIPVPGFPNNLLRPGKESLPDPVRQGMSYLVDDASIDISGRFMGAVRMLTRKGKAKVRTRPKILTLDDRQNVLHIGKEVPTFAGTAVTTDSQRGNLVSNINKVSKEYVGITLNLRPRITGEKAQEVVMQMDIAINELGERQRVFDEDLLGVPTVSVRRFTGTARVKNHTPIILGGLIQESEIESSNYIPILGDIPLIGNLFGRNYKNESRTEIIIIVTPHVVEENDPVAMPRESVNFDTQNSVLFNDRYILRGNDLIGVDHATGEPVNNGEESFTRDEVFDLTLLRIVKKKELVRKLDIFNQYMPKKAAELSWFQRNWPELTVHNWSKEDKDIYYEAAAYVIETVKNLNVSLDYEEIVRPRREIIIPNSPHRISLTYDSWEHLRDKGYEALRGEGKLDKATLELIQKASSHSFAEFARFVDRAGIQASAHNELKNELMTMYTKAYSDAESVQFLEYGDFYRRLTDKKFDFMTFYTYLMENEQRYKERGQPVFGTFANDLDTFLRMSIPIEQKAERLQELEEKWMSFQSGDLAQGT